MKKALLYYTDNRINMRMAITCRRHMERAGLPITCVSLKPTQFGRNIVLSLEPGYKTMYQQILAGLEAIGEDVVYFCEHDVLYHPSHFEFSPPNEGTYYYNGNYWFLRMTDGFAVHYDVSPLSGLVAYREPLIAHFRERLALIEKKGFGYYMGFEPMTHRRIRWEHWYGFEKFYPPWPNVDLCHGGNLTQKRWTPSRFIRKPKFWEESDVAHIPGWPDLPEIVAPFFPMRDGKRVN